MPASILILDDETTLRHFLQRALEDSGYETLPAGTVREALQIVGTRQIDCALLDQNLPDGHGITVLKAIKELDSDLPVIVMTAFGTIEQAKAAIRQGANDYVLKPIDLDELRLNLRQALEALGMRREIHRLRAELRQENDFVVGRSPAISEVANLIRRVAPTQASVLINGESGSGKEIAARLIHQTSLRAKQPFVAINCAAIPETLLESELFGYESGAFSGARRQRKGIIETADGGTLFLDEIGTMRLDMQAKLLRVLESHELRRVGGNQDIRVDLRILSATNRDLNAAIQAGEFREDLYWRLRVVEVNLPPLRDRVEDIDLFVARFVSDFAKSAVKDIGGVHPTALDILRRHTWPGNIRELRNVIERAVILCDGGEITVNHLPADLVGRTRLQPVPTSTAAPTNDFPPEGLDLKRRVVEMETWWVRQALRFAKGNQTLAAQLLRITRDELRYRISKYGIT